MSDIRTKHLVYETGTATDAQISQELHELWTELQTDAAVRKIAVLQNLDVTIVDGKPWSAVFQVRQQGAGFDPFTTQIIVGILIGVATNVATSAIERGIEALWYNWFLPKIKERLGEQALGKLISAQFLDKTNYSNSPLS